MTKISGQVLVKTANSGVPGVIVIAYDSEKSMEEIARPAWGNGGVDLSEIGNRLGSVVTDTDGRFQMEADGLEGHGGECWSHLVIVICAPEDVQGVQTLFSQPAEDRLLFISAVPRGSAGTEEAFIVRLLPEQLDNYGIQASVAAKDVSLDDDLATAGEEVWNFSDRLRQRRAPRLREVQAKNDVLAEQAQDKVQNLSAIPRHFRNDKGLGAPLLISRKTDLSADLAANQQRSIASGLERFAGRNTVLRLRLTKSELEAVGLAVDDGGVAGEIDGAKLRETVRKKTNGLDLVRRRGLSNPPPEHLVRKYLSADTSDDKEAPGAEAR